MKVDNFKQWKLLVNLMPDDANDMAEKSFSCSVDFPAPTYLVLNPNDSLKREIVYIHRSQWNICFYYPFNRTRPELYHAAWTTVALNDVAEFYNYIFQHLPDFWHVRARVWTQVEIKGGWIFINWSYHFINDAVITLTNNTINYIGFHINTRQFVNSTSVFTDPLILPLAEVIVSNNRIVNIINKKPSLIITSSSWWWTPSVIDWWTAAW